MLIIGKKLSPYALLSISGLLAASDQAVKWLVQQSMAYGEYVSVTPFFNWVHLWNTGAAFSLFANGGGWQRYFFIGIAVVVSIFLIKHPDDLDSDLYLLRQLIDDEIDRYQLEKRYITKSGNTIVWLISVHSSLK
ncbi:MULTISPECIES: signal peptidase II [Aeromonas]|uniref:signal peptidase II n=1 Tax=Aeromonas TaxID=642 RepID=UPI000A68CA42